MKPKENRFIRIQEPDDRTPNYYVIINKKSGQVIGWIDYYKNWKLFVFNPYQNTVWNSECLEFITNFLKSCVVTT